MKINSRILIISLGLKLLCLFTLNSELNSLLFLEFSKLFILEIINPWQYYFENNLSLDAFPYHPLMLYLLAPFAYFADSFQMDGLFKLPLFFFSSYCEIVYYIHEPL